MPLRAILAALLLGLVGLASANPYPSQLYSLQLTTLARGLNHPWSLAFLPDRRMLLTERAGRLRLLDAQGRLDPQPVSGVPAVVAVGQGGLFDVLPHPRFADNHLIYLSYAGGTPESSSTEIARARLDGHALRELTVIFRQLPRSDSDHHYGGRLLFDRAGKLYLSLGDRGEDARAQRHNDHAGSVIRLNDDGSVPPDNPWVGHPGWKPEKFTLGHRNQQGMALNPRTGAVWTHEHGPQGGDEVNVIRAGANYGWPVITYGKTYGLGLPIGEGTHKAGMEQPLKVWVPSIAPSGMAFYQGKPFARWQGDLLIGALKDQMLVRLKLDGDKVVAEERMLKGVLGRIRDVRVGPDGLVYLLTDEDDGKLVRVSPAASR
ncbi:PQQ-dependent sugar dehydrogenase [Pseudogulbenkiania subflava]|uniref:Glucose/arabinose dehydrogenase, beta-propeller fold n=1 Tax=Pseudogulbenkiania subflava DSM 22618 TaxID=1123014 RepID=A0A1Y6C2U4_9NEIS|nr:PQQ-dependent sugar dehydrogenase [Pseudogulbenkiania subflava]SMF38868.1 Glucose/arabinose dehydrogenase, beta-propeller fold [Pseudogulbenkiania subflava DSM 22618]